MEKEKEEFKPFVPAEKQMKELGQENIKEYLIKYEKTAKNMKMIFINKTERNNEGY